MKKSTTLIGLALVALLVVLVNVLASSWLGRSRVDITEDKLYTLAEGSKNIAASLDEPIALRFYFTSDVAREEFPPFLGLADRVEELLGEYVAESNGKLTLEVIDPEPFTDEEDDAVAAGLQAVPVGSGKDVIYFGLVGTNTIDGLAAIPFFDYQRADLFEYEISRLIYELMEPSRPRVGILSTLGIFGAEAQPFPGAPPPAQPWFIVQQLGEFFDVVGVNPTVTEIDPTIDILVVHHPKDLAVDALYAIDQFALSGGNVVVLVDPHAEEDTPPQDPNNPFAGASYVRNSDFNRVLSAWGVQMLPEVIAADASLALQVRAGTQAQPEAVTYIPWLALGPDQIVTGDQATEGLRSLNMPAPGVLLPMPGAETTFEPLLTTSKNAMRLEANKLKFFPDPKQLLANYEPGGEQLTLAARISGKVRTAFPDGRPGETEGAEEEPRAAHRTSASINAIVVADADFIADTWWVRIQSLFGTPIAQPTSSNGAFFMNALDTLVGNADLISIRSRGDYSRPFTRIEELRDTAEKEYLQEEQALEATLQETEASIARLQSEREDGSSQILTEEQRAEIERFQDVRLDTRKALRDVRRNLKRDIESLENTLTAVNAFFAPLLIVVALIVITIALRARGTKLVDSKGAEA